MRIYSLNIIACISIPSRPLLTCYFSKCASKPDYSMQVKSWEWGQFEISFKEIGLRLNFVLSVSPLVNILCMLIGNTIQKRDCLCRMKVRISWQCYSCESSPLQQVLCLPLYMKLEGLINLKWLEILF